MTISEGERESEREGLPLPIFRQVTNLARLDIRLFRRSVGRLVGRYIAQTGDYSVCQDWDV